MVTRIETTSAPEAIGPYSQAIVHNGLVYVSGQLPIDPKTNELIKGNIKELTKQILDNIQAILVASGSDLNHVIKTEVFLTDLDKDFSGMNEEYAKRFNPKVPPARQTIEVKGLPKGSTIEISCIAVASK